MVAAEAQMAKLIIYKYLQKKLLFIIKSFIRTAVFLLTINAFCFF